MDRMGHKYPKDLRERLLNYRDNQDWSKASKSEIEKA